MSLLMDAVFLVFLALVTGKGRENVIQYKANMTEQEALFCLVQMHQDLIGQFTSL